MNLGQTPPIDSGEPFRWILRPTLEWIQLTTPQKDSGEAFSWILRPTLQLKIRPTKANSSTEN